MWARRNPDQVLYFVRYVDIKDIRISCRIIVLTIYVSGTRIRPNKLKQQTSVEKKEDEKFENNETDQVQVEIVDQPTEVKEIKEKKEDEDVKDSWDADSTEDEQEESIVSCMIIKNHIDSHRS